MFVEDEHAVPRKVVVAGDGVAGEVVVHRLVKMDADGRILMVEQEINPRAFLLAHADLDIFGDFEQGLPPAHLAQPGNEVVIEMLVAQRADVMALPRPKVFIVMAGARLKILGVGRQDWQPFGSMMSHHSRAGCKWFVGNTPLKAR